MCCRGEIGTHKQSRCIYSSIYSSRGIALGVEARLPTASIVCLSDLGRARRNGDRRIHEEPADGRSLCQARADEQRCASEYLNRFLRWLPTAAATLSTCHRHDGLTLALLDPTAVVACSTRKIEPTFTATGSLSRSTVSTAGDNTSSSAPSARTHTVSSSVYPPAIPDPGAHASAGWCSQNSTTAGPAAGAGRWLASGGVSCLTFISRPAPPRRTAQRPQVTKLARCL
jgi:hypothetical protein